MGNRIQSIICRWLGITQWIIAAEKSATEAAHQASAAVARALSAEAKIVELTSRLAKLENAQMGVSQHVDDLAKQLKADRDEDRKAALRSVLGAQADLVDWSRVG